MLRRDLILKTIGFSIDRSYVKLCSKTTKNKKLNEESKIKYNPRTRRQVY